MSEKIKQEQVFSQNEQIDSLQNKQSQFNTSNWNKGHWSQEQYIKCIVFFEFNRHQLHSKLKMKQNKFFKQMSMFIGTRNPIQCRSQCHKLLRKHKTFYNAIANFKESFNLQEYDEIYKKLSKNDLIRFKGPEQSITTEQKIVRFMQITTQTQKSYLYKRYMKNNAANQNKLKFGQDLRNYPFLKSGWWM